jgi:hypothetical protein
MPIDARLLAKKIGGRDLVVDIKYIGRKAWFEYIGKGDDYSDKEYGDNVIAYLKDKFSIGFDYNTGEHKGEYSE